METLRYKFEKELSEKDLSGRRWDMPWDEQRIARLETMILELAEAVDDLRQEINDLVYPVTIK